MARTCESLFLFLLLHESRTSPIDEVVRMVSTALSTDYVRRLIVAWELFVVDADSMILWYGTYRRCRQRVSMIHIPQVYEIEFLSHCA